MALKDLRMWLKTSPRYAEDQKTADRSMISPSSGTSIQCGPQERQQSAEELYFEADALMKAKDFVAARAPHPANAVDSIPPHPANAVDSIPPHPATAVDSIPPHPTTAVDSIPPHPANAVDSIPPLATLKAID